MIDRLRAWLDAQDADAAWISDPVSIAYLTGFRTNPHERLMGLAVRPDGAVLVVPGLEQESAQRQAVGVEVAGWRDGTDPLVVVAAALGGVRRLAVETSHLTLAAADGLRSAAGTPELVDAGRHLRDLRRIKSVAELAHLERAAAITDEVLASVLEGLRRGQTELEVATGIAALIGARGGTLSFDTIVQTGPNSAEPHARPGARRLELGDLVLLDFGAAWHGYCADITRMAVAGRPDSRQREVHGVVLAARDAALAAVRPGVTAGEVDRAARRLIEEAGYGDAFSHRVGHGLGLEPHEAPSLDPGSDLVLEEGMVLTIEPGIYLRGWGGVRIEDDVVVEADGGRSLTSAPRHLFEVPVD